MSSNPRSVVLELSDASLKGILDIPAGASGMVAFAHGSGSSRLSPRNQAVAEFLNQAGLGTTVITLNQEAAADWFTGYLTGTQP